jgi:hypothetical protein
MSLPGEILMIICAILIASKLNQIAMHLGYLASIVRKRQSDDTVDATGRNRREAAGANARRSS